MADLLIDGLDEAVLQNLTHRAAMLGLDLEGYARVLLAREAGVHGKHMAELLEIQRDQPVQLSDSTELIRTVRDVGCSSPDSASEQSGKSDQAA